MANGDLAIKPVAVSQPAFIGVLWACVAISLCFVIFRVYVRLSVFHRIFADDALVLSAWLMLLAYAITWQLVFRVQYLLWDVAIGSVAPPADLLPQATKYLRAEIAINLLSTCGIWAIKLSFMVFFRKLGQNVRRHKLLWWIVLVATVIGFGISVGVYNWPCLIRSIEVVSVTCITPSAEKFTRLSLRIITSCDVITDALILSIPITLLWKVKLSGHNKLALLGLFSLTVFIMVMSIIRVVIALKGGTEVDFTWLYTWGTIEQTVAIMIACLVSYRALFHKESVPQQQKLSNDSSWRLLRDGTDKTIRRSGKTETTVEGGKISSSFLGEEVVPLDAIHVRHEYTVMPKSKPGAETI